MNTVVFSDMSRWRKVVVVSILVAACGGTASTTTLPPAPTTAPPTTAVTTTNPPPTTVATTTTPPTTLAPTTTISADPPIPDTSGDDWEQIIRDMTDFFYWILENPGPGSADLLAEIAIPGDLYYEGFFPLFKENEENNWVNLPGGRVDVRSVSLESLQDDGTTAFVLMIGDFDGSITVDENGSVVREFEDEPPQAFLFTLKLVGEEWLISESRVVGDMPGEPE